MSDIETSSDGTISPASADALERAVVERFVDLEVEPTVERLEVIELTVRFKGPPP